MDDDLTVLRKLLLAAVPFGATVSRSVDWLTLNKLAQGQSSRVPWSSEHDLVARALSFGFQGRRSALWWAVREDKPDYVGLLLACGADPGGGLSTSGQGGHMSPLMVCARYHGNVRIARLLVGAGADVDGNNSELARDSRHLRRVTRMSPTSGDSALMRAACYQHTDLVRFLLEFGADAAYATGHGRTALHEVAMGGPDEDGEGEARIQIAKLLIRYGALAHLSDRVGELDWPPSEYAEMKGRPRLAMVLREAESRARRNLRLACMTD